MNQVNHPPTATSREVFRIKNGPIDLVLFPLSIFHWKVLGGTAGFEKGDIVCGAKLISFAQAKEKVNADRTRLSPRSLVLLRGAGEAPNDREVGRLLRRRPWEPDPTPPAAA